MSGFINRLDEKLEKDGKPDVPKVGSFVEFLENHAQVKLPGGQYVQYSFKGRKVLRHIAERFDHILGSHTGEPLQDASFDICGGAQWGKTILALNLGVYLTSCQFFNWGYFLPDDDLVQGVVDSKLRPDVLEQIEWLPQLMEIGATEDKRGRKVTNRKGAFMVTDGDRKAFGMIRGMGKIPTTFSADCVMEDEKDDIDAYNAKFLTGRLSASDLRLKSSIGTQRKHGKGQHKQFTDGTQEVQMFRVPGEDRLINIEENWPQVCRLAVDGTPKPSDPKLTFAGNFKNEDDEVFDYDPSGYFYVADPDTGKVLDRDEPVFVERRPEMAKLRKWSIRVAQVAIAGISLSQPVSRWQDAVKDPEYMEVFYCDVLALPKNSSQALTPEIITRSRSVEDPFDLRLSLREGCKSFAGLDTGNRCWFYAREVESEFVKRSLWAEQIPLGDVVRRATVLFYRLNLGALFVDAHPAVDQARAITYAVNGLEDITWPSVSDPDNSRIEFPGGLVWDGKSKRWENLRGAVVQFTGKSGSPIVQKIGQDPQAGYTKYYPVIQCNRFDMINRAVNEFLTPKEEVIRVKDGQLIDDPVMRIAQKVAGSPAIVETLEAHLVTGSEKDEKGDYVDNCENHLLLANGYSALAELMSAGRQKRYIAPPKRVGKRSRRGRNSNRGLLG